jgi:hypothetical protein
MEQHRKSFPPVPHPKQKMPKMPNSLRDWQTDRFALSLKTGIGKLDAGTLSMDKSVTQCGYVDDSDLAITVLHTKEDHASIWAKVGMFFTEIVVSCGCGDEPLPTNASRDAGQDRQGERRGGLHPDPGMKCDAITRNGACRVFPRSLQRQLKAAVRFSDQC